MRAPWAGHVYMGNARVPRIDRRSPGGVGQSLVRFLFGSARRCHARRRGEQEIADELTCPLQPRQ